MVHVRGEAKITRPVHRPGLHGEFIHDLYPVVHAGHMEVSQGVELQPHRIFCGLHLVGEDQRARHVLRVAANSNALLAILLDLGMQQSKGR